MKEITWNGETWTLDSKGYFHIGRRALHREKWKALRGPIPKGWVVHHKDHDKTNNRITNLECMSHREHCRTHIQDHIHSDAGRAKGAEVLKKSAVARGKAISAGRLSIKKTRRPCKQCGKQFWSRLPQAELCSSKCRGNFYYQSRRYVETRVCPICASTYVCSKYDDQATCSKACGRIVGGRKRRKLG